MNLILLDFSWFVWCPQLLLDNTLQLLLEIKFIIIIIVIIIIIIIIIIIVSVRK